VRRCEVDYLVPARLDDMLEVRTRILELSGAAIEAEQIVARDDSELARLKLVLVCIGPRGRATRIPSAVRDAFSKRSSQSDKREKNG
jgi:acyl-CoA thioester hydrolase